MRWYEAEVLPSQLEVYVDDTIPVGRLAVLNGRLKAHALHRPDCRLIEAVAEAALDAKHRDRACGSNVNFDVNGSFQM